MEHSKSELHKNHKIKQEVLVVYNEECLLHHSSRKHPEQPFRITTIIDALSYAQIHTADELLQIKKIKDITLQDLQRMIAKVHGERYQEFIQYMWDESCKKSELYINTDTYYMKHTYQAAVAAVKTVILVTEAIIKKIYKYAYAVIRPPGHHSGLKNQPHGFSFFNNVALAAEFALKNERFKKIAIVDWDAHHGQGTQHLFYNRNDVLYISLHRFDNGKFFPHVSQSSSQHCGAAEGVGFNINICWNLPENKANSSYDRSESVGDEEYASAFQRIVMPVLQSYDCDLLLISCGFDSGDGDVIGNLKLSQAGYKLMTQSLKMLGKPMIAVLEGGYNGDVLSWGSQAVVNGLIEGEDESLNGLKYAKANSIGEEGISKCLQEIGKYWNLN